MTPDLWIYAGVGLALVIIVPLALQTLMWLMFAEIGAAALGAAIQSEKDEKP